jgi:hypothetical protein
MSDHLPLHLSEHDIELGRSINSRCLVGTKTLTVNITP